ncbi:MATE family efflux transporter [Lactococcus insecticola]|uniref:MATE family efflux transporter n=1 Tax=Pseudolactococcus insecticola TaxID=2709158 RepID=A0A6A0B9F8_9LACT|nr:MATE family efflux transporter [Lactococcus insecticola]GFH41091.1 MATE family efflux transporter [Lactococcus insecticola]
MKDLTKGNITTGLLLFTLPLLFGNFFQILYNTMDTLIVGQTLGKLALASVGSTGSINFLIVGFAQGMTAGLAIITAQRFGGKDATGVRKSFATGILFTVAISLLLGVISLIFVRQLLQLMQTPDEILAGAVTFLSIMLGGMIFANLFNFLSSALRAIGDSKTPVIALIISSIANIAFEYIAILLLHTGIAGAGFATLLAQLISVIFLTAHIHKHVPELHFTKTVLRFDKDEFVEHARLAIPMGFQSSIIAIGSITMQVALNTLGTNAVATQAIVSKIDQLAMLPMISIGLAMSTFAAQNYGAKQFKRITQGLTRSVLIAVFWGISFGVILNIFHHGFTTLFISPKQTQVIALSARYYLMNGGFYWILSILFVTRSTIQGLGNGKIPTIAGFMELIFRAIVAIIGVLLLNYTLVISANAAAWIGSTLILIPTTIKMIHSFNQKNA